MTSFKTLGMALLSLQMISCNHLFYVPTQTRHSTPDQFGLVYEDVHFRSADGTALHGWLIPQTTSEPPKGIIVQFHGNAENITNHYLSVVWLVRQGYHVFTFDYRGYGQSKGEPDLHGPIEDSEAALNYIRQRTDLETQKLILVGQSLGSAMVLAALNRAGVESVDAVVLDCGFSSYQDIAQDVLGRFWLSWPLQWPLSRLLIRDTYEPLAQLEQLPSVPLLFIHGTHDHIVPIYHTERMHDVAKEPKFFWRIPYGGHVDAWTHFGETYRPEFLKFLENPLQYELSSNL